MYRWKFLRFEWRSKVSHETRMRGLRVFFSFLRLRDELEKRTRDANVPSENVTELKQEQNKVSYTACRRIHCVFIIRHPLLRIIVNYLKQTQQLSRGLEWNLFHTKPAMHLACVFNGRSGILAESLATNEGDPLLVSRA